MKYRKKPVVIEAFQMTKERRWDNSEWPDITTAFTSTPLRYANEAGRYSKDKYHEI